MMGSMNIVYCVLLGLAVFLEDWIEGGQGRTSQWMFTDGSTTINSPVEEIAKEVKWCKGNLYKEVKKIVGSPLFVLDPAVENLGYKLANHSTKNMQLPMGGEEVCLMTSWTTRQVARIKECRRSMLTLFSHGRISKRPQ
jgi:hypothetical protein